MEEDEKSLRVGSFAAHATRGLIRDQSVRRTIMCVLLALATLMLIAGTTFLQGLLNPNDHVGWFLTFWLACAWLTITALLLAAFDLLLVRSQARAVKRALQEEIARAAAAARAKDNE